MHLHKRTTPKRYVQKTNQTKPNKKSTASHYPMICTLTCFSTLFTLEKCVCLGESHLHLSYQFYPITLKLHLMCYYIQKSSTLR